MGMRERCICICSSMAKTMLAVSLPLCGGTGTGGLCGCGMAKVRAQKRRILSGTAEGGVRGVAAFLYLGLRWGLFASPASSYHFQQSSSPV
jgi:hypothetical protein